MMFHKELEAGKWAELSFLEQMANIGSEVSRASNWKTKQNEIHANKAFERALELIDLTFLCGHRETVIKELCRTREELCLHFYESSAEEFNKLNRYFMPFAVAVRKNL